jgi:hypothetical protein
VLPPGSKDDILKPKKSVRKGVAIAMLKTTREDHIENEKYCIGKIISSFSKKSENVPFLRNCIQNSQKVLI